MPGGLSLHHRCRASYDGCHGHLIAHFHTSHRYPVFLTQDAPTVSLQSIANPSNICPPPQSCTTLMRLFATRRGVPIRRRTQVARAHGTPVDDRSGNPALPYLIRVRSFHVLTFPISDSIPVPGSSSFYRSRKSSNQVLHSRIAARMIQEVREAERKVPPAFAELTTRELEVLQLLADGQTNAAIAEQLVLSEKTVRGYVSNILSKLHMEDRTQAAVFAWQQGLME